MEVITDKCIRSDEFRTFWQRSNIDLSKGLNFKIRGPLYARVTHLQHTPFTYRIQVSDPILLTSKQFNYELKISSNIN